MISVKFKSVAWILSTFAIIILLGVSRLTVFAHPISYEINTTPLKCELVNSVGRCFLQNLISESYSGLNSSPGKKQRLDSIITNILKIDTREFYPGSKAEFSFDSVGNMTAIREYIWVRNYGRWIPFGKEENSFNEVGKMLLWTRYSRGMGDVSWMEDEKEEYGYDEDGNISLWMKYYWSQIRSQWRLTWKKEYTFNADGFRTEWVEYWWNEETAQWENRDKEKYAYDSNGKLASETRYVWKETTSQWESLWKNDYTYDEQGNKISDILSWWRDRTNQWDTDIKEEYTYDMNGNRTLHTDYWWDDSTNLWIAAGKEEYTYDPLGNPATWIWNRRNINTGLWYLFRNDEYTCDAFGNITYWIRYRWDMNSGQLNSREKMEYTYEESFTLDDLIIPPVSYLFDNFSHWVHHPVVRCDHPMCPSSNPDHMITAFTGFEFIDSIWYENLRGSLYYSEHMFTGLTGSMAGNIVVYPNPGKEYITFDISDIPIPVTVEIMDLRGRLVLCQQLHTPNQKISVHHLSGGI